MTKIAYYSSISFVLLLIFNVHISFAVNGYKNIHFGMSIDDVKKSNLCTFMSRPKSIQRLDVLECLNLKFFTDEAEAIAIFIDGCLQRFVIIPKNNNFEDLFNSLQKKYGSPSSTSTINEFNNVYNNPGSEVFVSFDDDTVILKYLYDYNRENIINIIYTTSSFDETFNKLKNEILIEDL